MSSHSSLISRSRSVEPVATKPAPITRARSHTTQSTIPTHLMSSDKASSETIHDELLLALLQRQKMDKEESARTAQERYAGADHDRSSQWEQLVLCVATERRKNKSLVEVNVALIRHIQHMDEVVKRLQSENSAYKEELRRVFT